MIRRYIHGWRIFLDLYLSQRRKKHGVGKRKATMAIYFALCGRWIVDGQHRGGRHPNVKLWSRMP